MKDETNKKVFFLQIRCDKKQVLDKLAKNKKKSFSRKKVWKKWISNLLRLLRSFWDRTKKSPLKFFSLFRHKAASRSRLFMSHQFNGMCSLTPGQWSLSYNTLRLNRPIIINRCKGYSCFSPSRPRFDSWHSQKRILMLLRFINCAG